MPVVIWVRVTAHIPPHYHPGDIIQVDLESTYIQECLQGGFMVRIPATDDRSEPATDVFPIQP